MKKAKLILDNKELDLDIIQGTESESAIDITKLRSQTGYITLDPGYANTGSCLSDITFIDGEKGILRYRGYPIEDLAGKVKFTDVAYLLLYGEVPNQDVKAEFSKSLRQHANIHEDMKRFFDGFPLNAHPMATLSSMVTALSTFAPELSSDDQDRINETIIKILAKVKTIAAYSYRKSHGLPFIYPDPELNYIENFLHSLQDNPDTTEEIDDMDPLNMSAYQNWLILS